MLRVAIVGCGSHSESAHAKPLAHYCAEHPDALRLCAACDLDVARAKRFCAAYGFEAAHADMGAMLNEIELDAVISVLPIDRIGPAARVLFERRIPCVVEKPPGESIPQVEKLASYAREMRAPHMVSLNRRFNPYLRRAIDWCAALGPLRFVSARMLRHARYESEFLWGTGIHVVDAMRHIAGSILDYHVERIEPRGMGSAWYTISMVFESGCHGMVEIMPTCGDVLESFELCGDGYRALAVTMGASGEMVRCWSAGSIEIDEAAPSGAPLFLRDGSFEELAYFAGALRDGLELGPTLDAVLPSLEICAASSVSLF